MADAISAVRDFAALHAAELCDSLRRGGHPQDLRQTIPKIVKQLLDVYESCSYSLDDGYTARMSGSSPRPRHAAAGPIPERRENPAPISGWSSRNDTADPGSVPGCEPDACPLRPSIPNLNDGEPQDVWSTTSIEISSTGDPHAPPSLLSEGPHELPQDDQSYASFEAFSITSPTPPSPSLSECDLVDQRPVDDRSDVTRINSEAAWEEHEGSAAGGGFRMAVWSTIRNGDVSALRALTLEPGWDSNLYEDPTDAASSGGTLLHMAAACTADEDFEVLELLVQSGADIERVDGRGRTALMICRGLGPFRYLVRQGANTQHRDASGQNCWHLAIANAEVAVLLWLAEEDPYADANLRVEDDLGRTPLGGPDALELASSCVRSNDTEALDLLLGKGISVHQRPFNNDGPAGKTLIEVACENGVHVSTFEKLLGFADFRRLDDLDNTSQGPIHHLIGWSPNRDQKLKLLLAKGASPDLMRWGRYPALVSYILENQHHAAMILLDHGADPAQVSSYGMDAAQAAASKGYRDLLEEIKSRVSGFKWGRTCSSQFTLTYPTGPETWTAADSNALHLAAYTGHEPALQFYSHHLKTDTNFEIDVNHPISGSLDRPVHFAAMNGSVACISTLHEQGAALTAQNCDGLTPLHLAALHGREGAVRRLLELAGERLNIIRDNNGLTPFMHAIRLGAQGVIDMFTDGYIFKLEPTAAARSRFIGEMMDSSIKLGDSALCESLLDNMSGINFDTCPLRCGCTPVMLAIRKKKLAVLELLLEWGCRGFFGSCSTHYSEGFNALETVSQHPELKNALAPLLSAYLEEEDWTMASVSPVHAAAVSGNDDAIRIIIQHIQDEEDKYRQEFCFGSLDPTTGISQSEMIQYVLNQRITARGAFGFAPGSTPLHISASKGYVDVTELLLQYGATVTAVDEAYDSPLHNAVKSEHNNILKMLLYHGADPCQAHGQGFSPLMAAVEGGNLSMTTTLVEAGADSKVVNMDGMGLLGIAGEQGYPMIVNYLLDLGLDPYTRDKTGYMSLDDLILNHNTLGYVLNRKFDLTLLGELPKGRLSLIVELNRDKSVSMLKRLLRLFQRPPEDGNVKEMVNYCPKRFVSPLCAAVQRDILGAIDVLVAYGADINVEGSGDGTPLMTACAKGRVESVKLLVRHGALISYQRVDGEVRNALDIAGKYPVIQRWLLVGRFVEKGRLENISGDAKLGQVAGVWTVACRLQVFAERPRDPYESGEQFLIRMARLRKMLKGKVVRSATLVRTMA